MRRVIVWMAFVLCGFALGVILFPERDRAGTSVVISTAPARGLLRADNMAPGDRVQSVLHVRNQGERDFRYTVSAHLVDGEETLYQGLVLRLMDPEGRILFEGPPSSLKGYDLGTVPTSECFHLTFEAELPPGSGNEYQGASLSLAFELKALRSKEPLTGREHGGGSPTGIRPFIIRQVE